MFQYSTVKNMVNEVLKGTHLFFFQIQIFTLIKQIT